MAKDQAFHDYVIADVLAHIPGISSRGMFGGWGIYKEGRIFAIIADGELYFKVGSANRADFEARGSRPFLYSRKDKDAVAMSYWLLPSEVMEDKYAVEKWVEKSAAVAGAVQRKNAHVRRRRR